ncbi:hypothetical protein FQN60_008396, partial [Etheostoma spectabile]
WLPAKKHLLSSLLCTKRASQAKILLLVRLHLNQPFLNHQELQGERFSCCEEGFRASKKVQHAPGPSPKVYSAAGLGHHHCRACAGMAAGGRDRDWTAEDWGKVIFSDESTSQLFGACGKKSLSGEDKVSATISPVSCQQ